jgi:hypothetical protein
MTDLKNTSIEMTTDEVKHVHMNDDEITWNTCCSHSSKSFIKYITTVLMSIIVLLFCIYMIASNPDNDNSIYFSLLSSILTLYIPAPTLESVNN